MTYDETLKIFAVLKANYNNFYKTITRVDAEAQVNLWAEMFADEPYQLVGAAVKAYIASDTNGYPPNVGKIKEIIRKLTEPEEMTEQEAVNLVLKATSNSLYNAESEFDKLPPILQRIVGSPNMLREWAMMDAKTVNSVIASNLMRSYKAVAEKQKEQQALPSSVRDLLAEAASRMSIDNGTQENKMLTS